MMEKLKATFDADDRAVSPVIGVILMVAITVVLAAVIGTMVLGMGDNVGDTGVAASADVEATDDSITVTHTAEDKDATTLRVEVRDASDDSVVDSAELSDPSDRHTFSTSDSDGISADSDYRVVVIAQNEDRTTTVVDEDVSIPASS